MEETSGRARQEHRGAEGPATGKPPRFLQGPGFRPRETKGEANRHRKRRLTQACGAGRRDEWRRLAGGGAGNVQVGGALHRERMRGEGVNERALATNSCG